ncbi:hypothetical protein KGA66_28065 [Actinocrinis puniceicyclus]|uniref:ABC transporter n=1 Tax=Actinocrinis puniceicyclus TaxID=977794 RepID=A0A8J8BE49_9ACTN|nr:hypothetical protein [Actinocrinis puniceicyclus]MBS2966922.1 hypothetical protein [Actinocrinis puniceicyclus]
MNTQDAAVARYYAVLLARSQRWLAPVLFYAVALAIDTASGDSAADAFAYTAAFLLPVSAWLTRAMLTAEPAEAASITATVAGPVRARLAALTAATGYGLLCAAVGALVSAVAGPLHGGATTLLTGVSTELICVLLGTAAGALAAPPLVPAAGWGVLLAGLLALGLLVARFSPAAMGIRALTLVANGSAPHYPLAALPAALVVVAAAWAASTAAAVRH